MPIMLNNVRLSFPSLWTTEKFGGEDTEKYAATFILNKKTHAKIIEEIKNQIEEMIKTGLKVKAIPPEKICLKDGDMTGRPENEDAYVIKASTKRRPTVMDRDKSPLLAEDGKPYGGCFVNAMIDLWPQNNSFGKRINAGLLAVQFAKDGEAFGTGPVDVSDEFDVLDEAVDF